MKIPDEFVTFLCVLLNCDRNDLVCTVGDDDDDTSDDVSSGNGSHSPKLTKLKSLFKVLYFMVHNGRCRPPVHLMCGEGIHADSKSKTLITSLNHLGISVSSDEILRYPVWNCCTRSYQLTRLYKNGAKDVLPKQYASKVPETS